MSSRSACISNCGFNGHMSNGSVTVLNRLKPLKGTSWIPIEKRPTWPSRATMGSKELAIVTEWKFEKDETEIAT
ncbi:hypothetical protein Tco_0026582 [Tanacetum coccineum]